jgi:hypothetical protein
MADDASFLPGLSPVAGEPVHVAFDGGRLTSDAGVVLLAEIERKLSMAERLARCIEDPRAPERVRHGLAEMIRYRMLRVAAGYPEGNDCDALRDDPAQDGGRPPARDGIGTLLAASPCGAAGSPRPHQVSRLENLPTKTTLIRMMDAMVDLFCDSFEQVPRRILLDIPRKPGRHARPGARRPAAVAVPYPPRQPVSSPDPCRQGDLRQAGDGDPQTGQDAGRP